MPSVEIIISSDGAVTASASGFTGQACEEATAFLNDLFKKQSVEHKDSYYEVDSIQVVDPLPSGFCG